MDWNHPTCLAKDFKKDFLLDYLFLAISHKPPMEDDDQNKKYMKKTHSICSELGNFGFFHKPSNEVSDASLSIGIGPTLFLLSTKGLAWFFLILAIINIAPAYIYYKNSDHSFIASETSDRNSMLDLYIQHTSRGGVKTLDPESLRLIIIFEIVTSCLFAVFIYMMEIDMKNYLEVYKNQKVEMDDFALKVKNLPRDL